MVTIKVKVNGAEVFPSLSGIGRVTPVSLRVNYEDPAELTLQVDRDIWAPAFRADSRVQLWVDGVLRFEGLSGIPRPFAKVGGAVIQEIVCRDRAHALGQAGLADNWDNSAIELDAGALSAVLAQYLPFVQEHLERVGVDTAFQYENGAEGAECTPVTIGSGNVAGGFREIAAAAPGVMCWLHPGDGKTQKPAYRFTRIFESPQYDLAFEAVRVPEIDLQVSLDGRCGAVRTGRTSQWGQATEYLERELTPGWNSKLEAGWSPAKANQTSTANEVAMAPERWADAQYYAWVYRRFSFAAFADILARNAAMVAVAYSTFESDAPVSWFIQVEDVDWETQHVMLRFPAIMDAPAGQPFGRDYIVSGAAKAATVALRFSYKGMTGMFGESIRVPAQGFGGRAYQLAPITCGCERLIGVPAGVDNETYCRQAFMAMSEPIVSGRVPINGDLPADLWGLNRRINIVRESGDATGYEALAAPLLGVTVEFASGGAASLEFNTDRSLLVRGGL